MIKFKITFIIFFNLVIPIYGQNNPTLIIDSTEILFSDVSFPYWLKAGQTINIGQNVKTVSILEFNVNGTALEFSKVISLTSNQIVPANKAWKIEAIGLIEKSNGSYPSLTLNSVSGSSENMPILFKSPKIFKTPGTHSWTVPPGITKIYVEVWGAGGGAGYYNGGWTTLCGNGGGGGYGYQVISVTPGTIYSINVGRGGEGGWAVSVNGTSGGQSSFGSIIVSNGGGGGTSNADINGIGGTSNASINISGGNGFYQANTNSMNGGYGGNGGQGGRRGCANNNPYLQLPESPGGGGACSRDCSSNSGGGGKGMDGQVIIYF